MPVFIATAPFTYEAPSSGGTGDDETKTAIGTHVTMNAALTSTSIGGAPLKAQAAPSLSRKGLRYAA